MKDPRVSVITLTYNQSSTIVQTVKSVLQQKTRHSVEYLILDDCSTDGTDEFLSNVESTPKIELNYIRNSQNLGVGLNAIKALDLCRGEYIAFCEGDDYWIDDFKIQKQVDFLDNNQQYGGVSTNNKWFFEETGECRPSILLEGPINFEDLCEKNLINSQTILFRKKLVMKREMLKSLSIGDWTLHLIITSQMPYYRLSDVTAVYRVHKGGTYSLLNKEVKLRSQLSVLQAVLLELSLNKARERLIKENICVLLKRLIQYRTRDLRRLRISYFCFGGRFFDLIIIKSYIYEIFRYSHRAKSRGNS